MLPVQLLCYFALAYLFSFFALPQACDVRYAYPTMLTAIFAVWMRLSLAGRDSII